MLTNFTKNSMLDHIFNGTSLWVGVQSSSDVVDTIITPRKTMTFTAANNGVAIGTSDSDVVIPAGSTVTHIAIYNAETGGELLGVFSLTIPETYGSEGSLSITGLEVTLS